VFVSCADNEAQRLDEGCMLISKPGEVEVRFEESIPPNSLSDIVMVLEQARVRSFRVDTSTYS